jgi:hypothetical protein
MAGPATSAAAGCGCSPDDKDDASARVAGVMTLVTDKHVEHIRWSMSARTKYVQIGSNSRPVQVDSKWLLQELTEQDAREI